jgi:ATP-dependent helicase/nuclease subunit A
VKFIPSDSELNFPHVMRVQASAGSGKTFLLACRFLQFLLSERIPRSRLGNLLAITFTNEATAEMRRRMLDLLKKAALREEGALAALAPLVDMPEERLTKAALTQVDQILSRYDDWQVKTIDSFVYRLVQAAPQELGLSLHEEIETHEAPLAASALDRLLLRSRRDDFLWSLLRDAVHHYLYFQARAAWWPRGSLLETLRGLLEMESIHGLGFEEPADRGAALALQQELSNRAHEFLQLPAARRLALKANSLKALEAASAGHLPHALSLAAWAKDELKDLCRKGADIPAELDRRWRRLKRLADRYAKARAEETAGPYLRLLAPWKQELSQLKAASRLLFFSDINRLAGRMLAEFYVPELVFRLGDRLYHFLIDEFQDTSAFQWKNLFPLLENALSQGGSIFCVGDGKQLLYRWRGSDIDVFRHGPEEFASLGERGLIDLRLNFNWRSRQVILDFVAGLFGRDNLDGWLQDDAARSEILDRDEVLDAFSTAEQRLPPHLKTEKAGGFVRVELMGIQGGAGEIQDYAQKWLVQLLNEDVLTRYDPRDVLVLVRDNGDVQGFTHSLRVAGVPVCSRRQLDVRNDPVVQELRELLCFLDRPSDDRAVAAVLTGRLLEEAWGKWTGGQQPARWVEAVCLQDRSRVRYLYKALQRDFPEFWAGTLEEAFGSVGFLPPYDLVSRVVRRLGLEDRFPGHREALRHLLELLHSEELWGGGDLAGFLQWMESGPEDAFMVNTGQDVNAVRVMTVHAAKGLEARAVVMPSASLGIRSDGRILVEENGSLRLFHTTAPLRNVSPALNRMHRREVARSWRDELNVLYVALTRAQDELYLLVPPKARGQANGLLCLLAPVLGDGSAGCLGEPLSKVSTEEGLTTDVEGEAAGPAGPGRSESWRWPLFLVRKSPEAGVLISPERRRAMGAGDAVHRLLARIEGPLQCRCDSSEVKGLLERLSADIWWDTLPEQGVRVDLDAIARTLCDTRARPLFWPGETASVWVEREVADRSGELYRIDRAVKDGRVLWLGEYKTGAVRSKRDQTQLARYCELMAELYPDCAVRGILLYLETEAVVEL